LKQLIMSKKVKQHSIRHFIQ